MPPKENWTSPDLAKKLEEQAEENKEYRHTLYKKVALQTKQHVLDIGCGTGVITKDIAEHTTGKVTGIDMSTDSLLYAQNYLKGLNITLIGAQAMDLPFKDNAFDLVVFCGVLMYVPDKQKAVNEMARVTKKNGIVLATVEPDYGDVIVYPEDPALQVVFNDLENIGADLKTGRKLRSLFSKAGLDPEVGLFTEYFDELNLDPDNQVKHYLERFWFIERSLRQNGWTSEQIEEYKQNQINLIKNRILFQFLPVFYAIGRKA
ncbi:MAG: methyltransferase domain-containing protein [Candidatus Methanofastidiosia archaeon]|jgi:ubiquinone/menaquinone biosynthesis C-methylase UbiE